ncbi:MAG: IPT/TIG domain-containing protein [Candidatus Solibacter sp.]
MRISGIACLVLLALPPFIFGQPQITQVSNNYSFLLPSNPSYGIARGSIFTIFGTGLSDSSTPLQNAPLRTSLNGVTARVTVGGTSTDVIWYYVTPKQLGGILPSSTPAGTGTITVTNNGRTSPAAPIVILDSAFGTLTLDQSGTGTAAVFDGRYNLLSTSGSTRPGDTVMLFGSGVGPIQSDETVQQQQVNMTNAPISVEIGGKPASLTYRGRTIFPGLDQINVVVPEQVRLGCNVPIVVKSRSIWSNVTTIPIAANGGSCPATTDQCAVNYLQPEPRGGITGWSPDHSQYLLNRDDDKGISQIYVGQKGQEAVCISCSDIPGGPKAKLRKMQPRWHPSGRWIVLAIEQENFERPPFFGDDVIEGWLQSGLWVDIWAAKPDGSAWYKIQDFGPANPANGFTGVAFTPDGSRGVWAQVVDGNIFKYGFGKWDLILADFREVNGVPSFTNLRDITPPDTFWLEPGNFSPNGKDLLLTADQGFPNHANVQGQDQFILDIVSGKMTNLTKSPTVWDEHGVFSPDGEKILFMSSWPYRSQLLASTILGLKTEFMIMDKDGSNLRQVTHFNEPGFAEYSSQAGVAAIGAWNYDGSTVSALNLFFPKYASWEIAFQGNCGRK